MNEKNYCYGYMVIFGRKKWRKVTKVFDETSLKRFFIKVDEELVKFRGGFTCEDLLEPWDEVCDLMCVIFMIFLF